MSSFLNDLKLWFQTDQAYAVLKAVLVLLVGLLVVRLISKYANFKRLHEQQSMILRKVVTSIVLIVVFLWVLRELGLDLGVLLGAAGILTVAIGFASQTSASNVISGLFLMGERSFQVGDLIRVSENLGYVLSIDFLSVKIRTFDNLLVRIPNEIMLKSQVTNLTRFPIRRIDLKLGVAYKEDLQKVRSLLFEIADRNPLVLDEPNPLFIFLGFENSAQEIQFSAWAVLENFLQVKNELYLEIKRCFDEAKIEIPYPHLSLYKGSQSEPWEVHLIGSNNKELDQGSKM